MAKRTEINDARDLRPALRRLIRFRKDTPEAIHDQITTATALMETESVKNAPVGVTGELRDSIFGEVREVHVPANTIEGRVGTPAIHGLPVELGTGPQGALRRPRRRPPAEALYDWVRIKFGLDDEADIKSAAFAVARKIGRKGTAPQYPFRRAWLTVRRRIRPLAVTGRSIARKVWG